jgi:hypothetical protein
MVLKWTAAFLVIASLVPDETIGIPRYRVYVYQSDPPSSDVDPAESLMSGMGYRYTNPTRSERSAILAA